MNAVKPIAQTKDTVTLRRGDFEALVNAAEDQIDLAALRAHRAHEDRLGYDTAKRDYLTLHESQRLLEGESPVRVWREKRGLTQRALAQATEIKPGYLAEIEKRRKPGSTEAIRRIAAFLEVPLEDLVANQTATSPSLPQLMSRSEQAAERLERLAKSGVGRDELAEEAYAIVAEWDEAAKADGVLHQVKAVIGRTESLVTDASTRWASEALTKDRLREHAAYRRLKRISDALEAAVDALHEAYRKH